ncbi:MAG: signal peptidase I [Clostridia bacterium]|nr:signal peptidase I [Clostridia bacterium]
MRYDYDERPAKGTSAKRPARSNDRAKRPSSGFDKRNVVYDDERPIKPTGSRKRAEPGDRLRAKKDGERVAKPLRRDEEPQSAGYGDRPRKSTARDGGKSTRAVSSKPRPAHGKKPVSRKPARGYAHDGGRKRPSPRKKRKRASGGMAILWMMLALVAAFAISLVLHNNVFEVIRMSGDSMYATLRRGDIVIVNKTDTQTVERGDLVAIDLGDDGYIIRRIVGLPGETVSIEEGVTYIDSNAITERYIGLETYDSFNAVTLPTGMYYVLCDNRTDLSDSRATDISMIDKGEIAGKATFIIWPIDRFGATG